MASKYPNSGAVFQNTHKKKPNQPDRTGNLTVTCPCGKETEYRVSGWLKDGKSGKFLSLSVKPKEARRDDPPPGVEEDEDSIPF